MVKPIPFAAPVALSASLLVSAAAEPAPKVNGTFDVGGTPGRITEGPAGNETFKLRPGKHELRVEAKANGAAGKPAPAKSKVVRG